MKLLDFAFPFRASTSTFTVCPKSSSQLEDRLSSTAAIPGDAPMGVYMVVAIAVLGDGDGAVIGDNDETDDGFVSDGDAVSTCCTMDAIEGGSLVDEVDCVTGVTVATGGVACDVGTAWVVAKDATVGGAAPVCVCVFGVD